MANTPELELESLYVRFFAKDDYSKIADVVKKKTEETEKQFKKVEESVRRVESLKEKVSREMKEREQTLENDRRDRQASLDAIIERRQRRLETVSLELQRRALEKRAKGELDAERSMYSKTLRMEDQKQRDIDLIQERARQERLRRAEEGHRLAERSRAERREDQGARLVEERRKRQEAIDAEINRKEMLRQHQAEMVLDNVRKRNIEATSLRKKAATEADLARRKTANAAAAAHRKKLLQDYYNQQAFLQGGGPGLLGFLFGGSKPSGGGPTGLKGLVASLGGVRGAFMAAGAAAIFAAYEFAKFDDAMTRIMVRTQDWEQQTRAAFTTAVFEVASRNRTGIMDLTKGLDILASSGLTAKAATEGLEAAQRFAAVSGMDMQHATAGLIDVLEMFHRKGIDIRKEMDHLSDMLIGIGPISRSTSQQLLDAFTNRLMVGVRQTNTSMEDTIALLAAISRSNKALRGSAGGDVLGRVMMEISRLSVKQKPIWSQILGEGVFDATGKIRPIIDVLDRMRERIGPLNKDVAEARLIMMGFEQRTAAALVSVLASSEGFRDLREQIDKMNGVTKKSNDMLNKTFLGQLQILWNQITIVATKVGEALVPAFEALNSIVSVIMVPLNAVAETLTLISNSLKDIATFNFEDLGNRWMKAFKLGGEEKPLEESMKQLQTENDKIKKQLGLTKQQEQDPEMKALIERLQGAERNKRELEKQKEQMGGFFGGRQLGRLGGDWLAKEESRALEQINKSLDTARNKIEKRKAEMMKKEIEHQDMLNIMQKAGGQGPGFEFKQISLNRFLLGGKAAESLEYQQLTVLQSMDARLALLVQARGGQTLNILPWPQNPVLGR